MIRRSVAVLVLVFAAPALADNWCEGRDAVPVEDGHYSFSYESWVRARFNAFMYGRCITVKGPTEKLINFWEGVLPKSIARKGRPTTGGQSFVERKSESRSAILHYGNSDGELITTYIGHELEPKAPSAPEKHETDFRKAINDVIEKDSKYVLENNYSFSTELREGNDASVADIDFTFMSSFDGKTFTYDVKYAFRPLSPDFVQSQLLIQFDGKELAEFDASSADDQKRIMSAGDGSFVFHAPASANFQADFIDNRISLVNEMGEAVTTMPVSYMLPGLE